MSVTDPAPPKERPEMTLQASPLAVRTTGLPDPADVTDLVDDVTGLTVAVRPPSARSAPGSAEWAEPETHVHDRSCWWDVSECRWSGPAHPDRRTA